MLSLIPNKYVDSDNEEETEEEAQVTVETVPTDFDDAQTRKKLLYNS